MKKIIVAILFLFFINEQLYSQYSETIRTARPGASVGPFTTGQNIFQIQSGITRSNTDFGDNTEFNEWRQFNSLRYGILEKVEIRSAFAFNSNEQVIEGASSTNVSGLSFWNVGVRFNITDKAGTRKPSLAFQSDIALTTIDEDFKSQNIAPRMLLIHSQQLNDWLGLTTNWGINWNGNDGTAVGIYTLNLSFPISDRLGSFIEAFGTIDNGEIAITYDAGLGYLVNNDLLLDVSIGYGDNNGSETLFVDGGVSWRFKVK